MATEDVLESETDEEDLLIAPEEVDGDLIGVITEKANENEDSVISEEDEVTEEEEEEKDPNDYGFGSYGG